MSDVNFADMIEWLDQDKNTSCISLYVEGLKDGRRIIDVGRNANKPIVALKSGVSAHGAAAAASHTGSLAGTQKFINQHSHKQVSFKRKTLIICLTARLSFTATPDER